MLNLSLSTVTVMAYIYSPESLKMETISSYHFSGISTQCHIWVQFLQNKVVPFFQFIPQDTALDKVYMCHVRNVPHTPRNNKTWRKEVLNFAVTDQINILEMLFFLHFIIRSINAYS